MQEYARYPLYYIDYYLCLYGFPELLDEREGSDNQKWWLRSFEELKSVKPLTGNDTLDHIIVEEWLLKTPFGQQSPSRNGIILMGIMGMRLIKYLWSE